MEEIIERHQAVFKDGYSVIKDFKATIHLKQGAKPVFRKNRAAPYAMREAIATELGRLEKNKVVSKVDHSEWVTPTVNIPKKDKMVRICGDYKITLNQMIDMDRYSLLTEEDIFATLAGAKQFTTLDLSHAYTQLEVADTSKECLTLNTHKELYRLNRLSYGVSSAPRFSRERWTRFCLASTE